MRSPIRAIPPSVERWASRARWLRWLDVLATAVFVWPVMALTTELEPAMAGGASLALVGTCALFPPLRLRWRPASAAVSLRVSRGLRPGDRAWYVRFDHVEPVIVTARRRWRLVVAGPDQEPAEGLEVRRTRVLIVPSDR